MSTTTREIGTTTKIGFFRHGWTDINPEQHHEQFSFEPRRGSWSNEELILSAPAGWHTSKSQGGTVELYDGKGQHVSLIRLASHGRAVEWASAAGYGWLPVAEATDGEGVVCPTCGHPR